MRRHRLLAYVLIAVVAATGAEAQAASTAKQPFPFELHAKLGGQAPLIVKALDVDRDGHADLVFDRAGGDDVALEWRQGFGNGSFGDRQTIQTWAGREVTGAEVANVDGQLGRDLIVGVSGTEGQTVEVLLRSGSAAFEHVASLPAPSERFALADVTGDAIRDLATAHEEGFAIRPGHGDGTFGAEQVVPVTLPCEEGVGCLDPVRSLRGLVGGPFVPGGSDDLVARYDNGLATLGGQLVLASKPEGGFEQGEFNYDHRGTLDFLLARDLDGDGFLDLIAGGSNAITSPSLYALYGDASGAFEADERNGANTLGPEPGVFDTDRDGDLDLVAPVADNSPQTGTFTYLKASGRSFATFQKGKNSSRGAGPVATRDFNEDGWRDFASTVFGKTPRLTVWLNSRQAP